MGRVSGVVSRDCEGLRVPRAEVGGEDCDGLCKTREIPIFEKRAKS